MKKLKVYLMTIMLVFGAFTAANAYSENPAATPKVAPAEVEVMLNRLEEIKDMDKSNLSPSERKALRKEVREIKKDIKSSGNGLYISFGALIIILLLIIIL